MPIPSYLPCPDAHEETNDAGGKLAAEALRVLKKSIQHAGARKTGLGRRPLIPVAPGPALAWWEKGAEHKTKTGAGPSASGCLVGWHLLLPTPLSGSEP